uniref:snRNA-activating protein complex subunit 4 n=1 Tax=Ditylenchus dipsaci TaxID=166011 RepID=A0A915D7W7_9BILA
MTDSKSGSYCGDELLFKLVQMKACNETYLKYVERLIDKLDEDIDHNRKQQAHVQNQIRKQQVPSSHHRKNYPVFVYWVPYLPPYFKDADGMMPSWNIEQWKMSEVCAVNPLMGVERKWIDLEVQLLRDSVAKSLTRNETIPLSLRRDKIVEKLTVTCTAVPKSTKMLWVSQIKQIDRRIEYLRSRSSEEVLGANNSFDVDWDKISAADFGGSRSPVQIRMKWHSELSPTISTAAWSEVEDGCLLKLLHGPCVNWDDVAGQLGTSRNAFQCFMRLRYLQGNELTSTVRGKINWQKIMSHFPNKTKYQCMGRYKRSVNEKLGRGRWTLEEDLQLCFAIDKYGPQRWEQVAEYVRTRSSLQCRERWINVLDPKRRNNPWIWEEHLRLFFGLKVFGRRNFSKVALMLPGRNSADVKTRVIALKNFKFSAFEAEQDGQEAPIYEIMSRHLFHTKSRREMVLSTFRELKKKNMPESDATDIGLGSFIFSSSGVQADYSDKKQRYSEEFGKLVFRSGYLRKIQKNPNEFASEELEEEIGKLPHNKQEEVKRFLAESDIRYAAELQKENACIGDMDELIDFYESIMTVGRAKELQKHLSEVISIDKIDVVRRSKSIKRSAEPEEFLEEDENNLADEIPPKRMCVLKEYDYSSLVSS